MGHQEVAHSVLEPKEGTDKAAQAWAKWGEIAWQRRAYSIKDKGKRTKHVERKRRDSSQQHRATVQLDMNVNSVVWKRRRDDKGENEMKGGVWILGMNKAACHKPEDLNSRGWDSVTIRSLGKGKAEDTTQSEADRLEGRAQPNWRGREPVWCGLRAYKELSRNAKETAPGSPEHTLILLTLLYPLLMSACLLVTAPKLRTPILGER